MLHLHVTVVRPLQRKYSLSQQNNNYNYKAIEKVMLNMKWLVLLLL